mgnify:CR=1 FL=1
MEMKGVTKQVIIEILGLKKNYKNVYDQKCFIIGITQILTVMDAPDIIKDPSTLSKLMAEILYMLEKVKKKEVKEALKKATKQIHDDGSDYDSDDSGYDDTSSDDDDEVTLKDNGKRSRKNSSAEEMMSDEENKDDGGGLGFVNPGDEEKKSGDSDDSDDEYDNQVSTNFYVNSFFSSNSLSQLIKSRALFSRRTSSSCLATPLMQLPSRDLTILL